MPYQLRRRGGQRGCKFVRALTSPSLHGKHRVLSARKTVSRSFHRLTSTFVETSLFADYSSNNFSIPHLHVSRATLISRNLCLKHSSFKTSNKLSSSERVQHSATFGGDGGLRLNSTVLWLTISLNDAE